MQSQLQHQLLHHHQRKKRVAAPLCCRPSFTWRIRLASKVRNFKQLSLVACQMPEALRQGLALVLGQVGLHFRVIGKESHKATCAHGDGRCTGHRAAVVQCTTCDAAQRHHMSTRPSPELFWYANMNPPSAPMVAAIAADCLETLAVVPAGTIPSPSAGAGSSAD